MAEQTDFHTAKRILVVDDDTICRSMIARGLTRLGYDTCSADSARQAREILESESLQTDCVVSDYRMPGEDGVDLLRWLNSFDSSISTIMLTSEGDKRSIAEMLREGACDYLEKPVEFDQLQPSVEAAIARTRKRRRMRATVSAVDQVGETISQLIGINQLAALDEFSICYRPMHQAGGDFINCFTLPGNRRLILVTDVSGHDLNAAYISSFFQGMVRGMIEKESEIDDVLSFFNRFLLDEWNTDDAADSGREYVSLSVCAAVIDTEKQTVVLSNFGFPPPVYVDGFGDVHCATDSGSPLGWFPDAGGIQETVSYANGGYLFFRSDGLEDLALDLNVAPDALAHRLLHAPPDERERLLSLARDDVLVVRFDLEHPETDRAGLQPILTAKYRGDQSAEIDALQESWKRTLEFVLTDASDSKIFDILLCTREAVLNAVQHGCSGEADQECQLWILYLPDEARIHVCVWDPGEGFSSNAEETPFVDDGIDRHCGIILIQQIPEHCELTHHGSHVRMVFNLSIPVAVAA